MNKEDESNVCKYLLILCLIFAGIVLYVFPKWTVDDSYILYRYAENLAEHGELNWNVGEDPVEGFSSVFLTVALALFIKLGMSPVIVSKVIGLIAFIAGGGVLLLIFRKLNIKGWVFIIPFFLYCSSPFMYSHVWSGMETMLFICFIVLDIYLLVLNSEAAKRNWVLEALLLFSLLLTSFVRPEGVILAVTSIIALAVIYGKHRKVSCFPLLKWGALIYLLPGLVYFVWRLSYYGQFFPNTYYAKQYPGLISKFSIYGFVLFFIFFLAIPAISALLLNGLNFKGVKGYFNREGRKESSPRHLIIGLSLLTFSVIVFLQYMRSRLLMNFEFRFYVPFYPIFLIFLGYFLQSGTAVINMTKERKPVLHKLVIAALIVLAAAQIGINFKELKKYIFLRGGYYRLIEDEHIPAGKFLRENVPEDEWLIVIHDCGAIPYYSKLKTVDFSRLNNRDLLTKDMSEFEIIDYFFSFNAGAVVITSYKYDKIDQLWIYGREAEAIAADPRFDNYRLVKKYKARVVPENPSYNYFMFIYLRQDLFDKLDISNLVNP